ncbi:PREDICTED: translation initiation factor IF-2-like isoform X1 [Corvus brachyrhynchos]|uniref:translation initiation factor IF-2-like isoform X1 n=1 Tax=Corvus brachyrhynchos TaxID=85066 RepID=UPI000816370F|nr:PREDICTED: translation initiation factor IF-2-like isoform X1 [Corvus brachyrhynchos]
MSRVTTKAPKIKPAENPEGQCCFLWLRVVRVAVGAALHGSKNQKKPSSLSPERKSHPSRGFSARKSLPGRIQSHQLGCGNAKSSQLRVLAKLQKSWDSANPGGGREETTPNHPQGVARRCSRHLEMLQGQTLSQIPLFPCSPGPKIAVFREKRPSAPTSCPKILGKRGCAGSAEGFGLGRREKPRLRSSGPAGTREVAPFRQIPAPKRCPGRGTGPASQPRSGSTFPGQGGGCGGNPADLGCWALPRPSSDFHLFPGFLPFSSSPSSFAELQGFSRFWGAKGGVMLQSFPCLWKTGFPLF